MLNLGRINMTGACAAWERYAHAASGVSRSVQANAVFFHTLFNAEWLDPETVAQMIDTIEASDEDIPLSVDYGLVVRELAIDGGSVHGHTGVVPGFSSISMHNLEHGFTIVVLGNVSTIEQTNLYAELQSVVMRSE